MQPLTTCTSVDASGQLSGTSPASRGLDALPFPPPSHDPSPQNCPRRRRSSRQRGFSLIEVTLAIGVFAFAGTAIMAGLGLAMQTQGNAFQTTVRAQILQSVLADIRGADFSLMATTQTWPELFYDQSGVRKEASDPSVVYGVVITSITGVKMPGEPTPNPNLVHLDVVVSRPPGNLNGSFRYPLIVANNGL